MTLRCEVQELDGLAAETGVQSRDDQQGCCYADDAGYHVTRVALLLLLLCHYKLNWYF